MLGILPRKKGLRSDQSDSEHVCVCAFVHMFMWIFEGICMQYDVCMLLKFNSTYYFCTTHLLLLMF